MKRYGAVTLPNTSFLFNEIFLSVEDLAERPFYLHIKNFLIKDFFSIYLRCFSKPMADFKHGDSVRPECIPGVELDPFSEHAQG